MGKILYSVLAAGILAASVPALAQGSDLEKTDVTISVGGSISQMNKVAYSIALNKGFFKKEGLTVHSTAFNSGTKALQSIVSGGVDLAEAAYEHTIDLQAKGVDLTCLVVFGRYPGNVLVVNANEADKLKTPADLKGKRIGVSAPGSSTQNFAAQVLERAGVSWKDARYINVGTGLSAVAAMEDGNQLDALVNLDPAITDVVDSGKAKIMVDTRTGADSKAVFGGNYLADCLMAKSSFIKKYPHTSEAIAKAVVHAMQWLKTASIDDIIAALPPKYYNADEAVYRKSLKANLPAFQWDGIVMPDAARNVLNTMSLLRPELKSAKLDLAKTYDNDLVRRALKTYKTDGK